MNILLGSASRTRESRSMLFAAALVIYLFAFGGGALYGGALMRLSETPHFRGLASIILIGMSLGAWLLLTFAGSGFAIGPRAAGAGTLLLTLAWVYLEFRTPHRWLLHHLNWVEPLRALQTAILCLACCCLGCLFATAFKDRNLVAVGAVVGGLVDYWGVSIGSTKLIVSHAPRIVEHVAVHLPQSRVMHGVPLLVGPGDYVFAGILLALVQRHDLRPRVVALVMWGLLVAAMAGVLFLGWSIPAVAPMAVAVLLPNLNQFHFKRSELFALAYGGILLIVLGFAATWYIPHVFHSSAKRQQSTQQPPAARVEPPLR
jgi:hypothetical protein